MILTREQAIAMLDAHGIEHEDKRVMGVELSVTVGEVSRLVVTYEADFEKLAQALSPGKTDGRS